jgi:hypothetical protein
MGNIHPISLLLGDFAMEPPITVDAFTMNAPDFQSCQTEQSHAQSSRSVVVNFGRLTERWRTPI